MAEFNFFFNEQDELSLIEFILKDLSLSLVPDRYYDTSDHIVIKDMESYKKLQDFFAYGGTYYLLGDGFYKCPLEMHQLTKGENRGKYYIEPQYGGPAIDVHFRTARKESGERLVSPGFVSHYPYYWVTRVNRNEKVKVPEKLKKAYNEIVKFIKRNSVPCEPVIRQRIWAGKYAVGEFMKGQLKFEWNNRNYSPSQRR